MLKLASNYISMRLMLSRHGNKRHCHLFKFLLQQNGNSEGSCIPVLCYLRMLGSISSEKYWISLGYHYMGALLFVLKGQAFATSTDTVKKYI